MGYELIITEKPKAAQNIANALADGKSVKKSFKGVPYYELSRGKHKIVVTCAVGHLYQLAQKKKEKFTYPVFDVEWKPNYLVTKAASYSKKYLDSIKSLTRGADTFTVATDYDVEGEVIGYNVIKYACEQDDASRMKFSTLTKPDLVESYAHKEPHLNWGQVHAGLTRHTLDWIYGINLSRALTSSVKKAGSFKILSVGRVQGPALKIIVDKEREIKAFKSVPFWQIELLGSVDNDTITAMHAKDKFWDEPEAKGVMERTRGKSAAVKDIDKSEFTQSPPTPFDLTTLQVEAFRVFRISPKDLLSYAQNLYIAGCISYPRTSSQELPAAIGYAKIMADLAQQSQYKALCEELLDKPLKPNNGKKTDPAHPAIYPTGVAPNELTDRERKVYDLIVKRYLAVFAEPAKRLTVTITIDVNKEPFIAKGTTTVFSGWHRFYEPYVHLKEEEMPVVAKGEAVTVKSITLLSKETQPPKRYTQASIVKELANRNLGTKATRATVVDTLYQRGYVTGESIEASHLGINTVETLEKYSPSILDEELTRKFEDEMEQISEDKRKSEDVIDEAKILLTDVLAEFKKKEALVGGELAQAKMASDEKEATLGICPLCKSTLMLRRGKFGPFIACKNYPECKTTFRVPAGVGVKAANKTCEVCGYPMVKLIKKGKRPQEICLNVSCASKKVEGEDKIEKTCPLCSSPLVLRRSMYGRFLGCSTYPKCKHIEKLANGNGAATQ